MAAAALIPAALTSVPPRLPEALSRKPLSQANILVQDGGQNGLKRNKEGR